MAPSCVGSYSSQPVRRRRAVSRAMWVRAMERRYVDRVDGVGGDADVEAQRQQHALDLERRVEPGDEQPGGGGGVLDSTTSRRMAANSLGPMLGQLGRLGQQPAIRRQACMSRSSVLAWPRRR